MINIPLRSVRRCVRGGTCAGDRSWRRLFSDWLESSDVDSGIRKCLLQTGARSFETVVKSILMKWLNFIQSLNLNERSPASKTSSRKCPAGEHWSGVTRLCSPVTFQQSRGGGCSARPVCFHEEHPGSDLRHLYHCLLYTAPPCFI